MSYHLGMTISPTQNIEITLEDAATAFAEWERRYREDPEEADRFYEEVLKGQPEEAYGEASTRYFAWLLSDLGIIELEETEENTD